MTTALYLVAAGLFFVGGVLLVTRRRLRSESNARDRDEVSDDVVDLTRRHATTTRSPSPSPGGPEWSPPGREPEARA